MAEQQDTYPTPEHGWVCFHCGEHFPGDTPGWQAAKEHFGDHIFATPACQIWENAKSRFSVVRKLVRKIRWLEKDLAERVNAMAAEDTEADRRYYAQQSEHSTALIREEEKGYARGLRDALRKVALVKTYKADGTFIRNDCEICEATCGPDQMLTHVGDCPLTVLNPQQ